LGNFRVAVVAVVAASKTVAFVNTTHLAIAVLGKLVKAWLTDQGGYDGLVS
jgi:hypothetical protein